MSESTNVIIAVIVTAVIFYFIYYKPNRTTIESLMKEQERLLLKINELNLKSKNIADLEQQHKEAIEAKQKYYDLEIQKLELKIVEIQKDLDSKILLLKQTENKNTGVMIQVAKAEADKQLAMASVDKIRAELEQLKLTTTNKYLDLQKQYDSLTQKYNTLNEEKSRIDSKILTLTQNNNNLQEYKTKYEEILRNQTTLNNEIQANKVEITRLTGVANNYKSQLDSMVAQNNNFVDENSKLNQQLTQLNSELETIRNQLSIKSAELSSKDVSVQELQTKYDTVINEKNQLMLQITVNEAKIKQLSDSYNILKNDYANSQLVVDELKTNNDKLKSYLTLTMDDLKRALADLDSKNSDLAKCLLEKTNLQTAFDELNAKYTIYESENKQLKAVVQQLNEEKTALNGQLNIEKERADSLNKQLNDIMINHANEIQTFNTQLSNKDNKISELLIEIDNKNKRIQQLEDELNTLKSTSVSSAIAPEIISLIDKSLSVIKQFNPHLSKLPKLSEIADDKKIAYIKDVNSVLTVPNNYNYINQLYQSADAVISDIKTASNSIISVLNDKNQQREQQGVQIWKMYQELRGPSEWLFVALPMYMKADAPINTYTLDSGCGTVIYKRPFSGWENERLSSEGLTKVHEPPTMPHYLFPTPVYSNNDAIFRLSADQPIEIRSLNYTYTPHRVNGFDTIGMRTNTYQFFNVKPGDKFSIKNNGASITRILGRVWWKKCLMALEALSADKYYDKYLNPVRYDLSNIYNMMTSDGRRITFSGRIKLNPGEEVVIEMPNVELVPPKSIIEVPCQGIPMIIPNICYDSKLAEYAEFADLSSRSQYNVSWNFQRGDSWKSGYFNQYAVFQNNQPKFAVMMWKCRASNVNENIAKLQPALPYSTYSVNNNASKLELLPIDDLEKRVQENNLMPNYVKEFGI